MKAVTQLLSGVVDRGEVLRAAHAQSILRRWSEFVGPELAARSLPDQFEKGTVWVAVSASSWAQELRMQAPVILDRLNQEAGTKLFVAIRCGVRPRRGLPPIPASPEPKPTMNYDGMSIKEIAARRLAMWEQEERDDEGSTPA